VAAACELQDFGFPSACHKIKVTADRQYIVATGVHAPRVAVYDVEQLAMKFERHFDSEVVDFQVQDTLLQLVCLVAHVLRSCCAVLRSCCAAVITM
jgi:hypothetical protein